MTQIHFYDTGTDRHIKDWPNWTGIVPASGDMVALHYGDNNEEERHYVVKTRTISGTDPDDIRIFIQEIRDDTTPSEVEIEALRKEIESYNH